MRNDEKIVIRCPAKINLFLRILGKESRHHNIQSALVNIDLYDVIEISKSDKFEFFVDGEFAKLLEPVPKLFASDVSKEPRDEEQSISSPCVVLERALVNKKNLIEEVVDYFSHNYNKEIKNLKIKLTKSIPIGAGLGGGSSDAAYLIMTINELFSLSLTKKKMQEISINFGSDIAFFFEQKPSIISGIGGEIHPLEPLFENPEGGDKENAETLVLRRHSSNMRYPILLVYPNIAVSTKEVYENFAEAFSNKIDNKKLQKKDIFSLAKISNDLTNPAISILPVIKNILDKIEQRGGIAKMSGSGSSCFGIFSDETKLEIAYQNFLKNFSNFFIKKVNIF
jgi:4-diphosphocytidyl-2-C-methyl-D-erythritol kinase